MGNLAPSADKPAGQTPVAAAAGPVTASAASGAAAERRASSNGVTLEEFMGAQQYIGWSWACLGPSTHAKMMRDFLLRLQQEQEQAQAQRAVLEAGQAQRKLPWLRSKFSYVLALLDLWEGMGAARTAWAATAASGFAAFVGFAGPAPEPGTALALALPILSSPSPSSSSSLPSQSAREVLEAGLHEAAACACLCLRLSLPRLTVPLELSRPSNVLSTCSWRSNCSSPRMSTPSPMAVSGSSSISGL